MMTESSLYKVWHDCSDQIYRCECVIFGRWFCINTFLILQYRYKLISTFLEVAFKMYLPLNLKGFSMKIGAEIMPYILCYFRAGKWWLINVYGPQATLWIHANDTDRSLILNSLGSNPLHHIRLLLQLITSHSQSVLTCFLQVSISSSQLHYNLISLKMPESFKQRMPVLQIQYQLFRGEFTNPANRECSQSFGYCFGTNIN